MGRGSAKENKNLYHSIREDRLGLTREKASALLECISPEKIEKIENEKCVPHPDEILVMADKYNAPELCNYFCSNQCPIGKKYVPEIKMKDLSQIVLGMLSSLNSMNTKKDRLIDITADGSIDVSEYLTFIEIQEELNKIVNLTNVLQLWTQNMIASGNIDKNELENVKNNKK